MTSKLTRDELNEVVSTYGKSHIAHRMAVELLAAMDSEPVAYTDERNLGYIDRGRETAYLWGKQNSEASDVALYRHAQPASVVMDDKKLRELFDAWFASDCSFDQSPEASEADNIAWRESYWYVWQRCCSAMLQEIQKSAGTEELCRSNENAQVLHSIEAASALSSLPKTGEVLHTNSSVNDVIAGKPFTIFLPDISSKAFWSGAGKNETFHPETYRRWVKEAIERYCAIARIDVEVK